jgi:hypothetical protein
MVNIIRVSLAQTSLQAKIGTARNSIQEILEAKVGDTLHRNHIDRLSDFC